MAAVKPKLGECQQNMAAGDVQLFINPSQDSSCRQCLLVYAAAAAG
jgi:hypothetical protein